MKIYLTTDTHFGHGKLVELGVRPYGFDKKIYQYLEPLNNPDTLIIHLGDFCVGMDGSHHHTYFEKMDKCTHWLLRGNHDRKSAAWYLRWGWAFVGDQIITTLFGLRICFSHKPVEDLGQYDVNIHGHLHNDTHRSHEPELARIRSPKQYLLSLEASDYKPWDLQTLVFKTLKVKGNPNLDLNRPPKI